MEKYLISFILTRKLPSYLDKNSEVIRPFTHTFLEVKLFFLFLFFKDWISKC